MIITLETMKNEETQREIIREINNLLQTIKSTSYPNLDVFDLKFQLSLIEEVKKEESYY